MIMNEEVCVLRVRVSRLIACMTSAGAVYTYMYCCVCKVFMSVQNFVYM